MPANSLATVGRFPSVQETRTIQAFIQKTEEYTKRVQLEILALKTSVKALEGLQSELKSIVARQRNCLAPIRRLPVELLLLIFDWSCRDQVAGPFHCMPVDISEVCSLWRDIMYSNPKIWTNICWPTAGDLALGHAHGRFQTMLRYFDVCFRAMKGLPSSQLISFAPSLSRIDRMVRTEMVEQPGPSVLSVFAQYTDQWGALHLSDHIPYKALRCRPYSQLHTLDIEVSVMYRSSALETVFLTTPALRTVVLRNRYHLSVIPSLPWANVRVLHTISNYIPALAALSLCTNVVEWTHDDLPLRGLPSPARIAAAPRHLQTLRINNVDGGGDSRMLDYITAPSLTSLSLFWDPKIVHSYTLPYLSTFIERSQRPITELVLRYPPASEHVYATSLSDARTVAVLSRRDVPLTDDALASFAAVSAGEPVVWPKLEELELGGHGCYHGRAVVDMVEARRACGRPLRSLDLDLLLVDMDHFGGLEVIDQLRELVPEFVGPD